MAEVKYLIRLDDACPYMDKKKWERIEQILDEFKISPLVGIIPANEDNDTRINDEDPDFWDKAVNWEKKGWHIALHGYNHCCTTTSGGINPVHGRSEFAGLDYDTQKTKIRNGYDILTSHNLHPECFFAPSHTFDKLTIRAIAENTPIRYISDTFTRRPYLYNKDITILPCQMGKVRNIPLAGYWTFCIHPNLMDEESMNELKEFIRINRTKFIPYGEIMEVSPQRLKQMDKILKNSYILMRKIRQLIKTPFPNISYS